MKRVLFVDDERPILDGLRARLHGLRSKWDMVFVESAPRALAELEICSFDVVVSDMRMPGMDGTALLQTVSTRWPETIRIVLSGYSDQAQALRVVPVAHQYLTKPSEAKTIETIVERCLSLQELLAGAELRAIVGRLKQLPTIPRTYARLREALNDETATIQDVAAIVSKDAAVAAKIMQMVNSAFFRRGRHTTRIDLAVSYLGLSVIEALTLSTEVFSASADRHGGAWLEKIQQHAELVAMLAGSLATGSSQRDDGILAALLHEIGQLVLAQELPEQMDAARALAERERIPLVQAERSLLGTTHSEMGAYLLGLWGLPYAVVEAVAHHHSIADSKADRFDLTALLCLAHAFAAEHEGSAADAIDDSLLDTLAVPYSMEEARQRTRLIFEPELGASQ